MEEVNIIILQYYYIFQKIYKKNIYIKINLGIHVILKSSEISIEEVSISENYAELSGGAVYIDSLDNFTLKNS